MKDEALRLALEALEKLFGIPDMLTGENSGDVAVWRLGGSYRTQQAITAIKQALAAPVQEPVGWIDSKGFMICVKTDESCRPLYTTPQRTWVGLTDEEVNQLYTQIQEQVDKHWVDGGTSMMFPTTLYKAIEAKLKEKNNG